MSPETGGTGPPRRIETIQAEALERQESIDVQGMHAPIMREKREPRDGYEPVPTWLAGVSGALVFWGGWYMGAYMGTTTTLEGAYQIASAEASKKEVDPVARGKQLYAAQGCVSCHQAGGQGVPGQYPPLKGSEWVLGSPARLTRILLHGLQGPVEVLGSTFNGNMPAFGAKLKDDQLAAVLTFIRQEWGNSAEPIAAEVVAAARAATTSRTAPWTAQELTSINEEDPLPEKPSEEKGTKGEKSTNAEATSNTK